MTPHCTHWIADDVEECCGCGKQGPMREMMLEECES